MKLSLLLLMATVGGPQVVPQTDDWYWSETEATLARSMSEVKKPYLADLKTIEGNQILQISEKGRIAASVPTHQYSVFVIKDTKLFVAEFHYMSTGCVVECFDLKRGKSLWQSSLKGIGPIAHSKYFNRVLMRFESGSLIVYGKESAGRYREKIDPKSGKTLDNKVFPRP